MSKRSIRAFRPVYPTPVGMITSVSSEGKPNIITLGEVFNVSLANPPITGIAVRKATYSHGLISSSREFVINLPSRSLMSQADWCGSNSGRDVDKFAESGLTALPASQVKPPLIAECLVNLECKVLSIQEIGDHDLFLGEVVEAHADESILDDEGKVDYGRLEAFCFMFHFGEKGEYWSIGEKIGEAFSRRKEGPPRRSS
jgi:flavin reductase (DIM6/NTAB) family NADH-FMN oxidoreductase RutF